jgi:peptide/nickel transport system ATP-binding protein
LNKLLTVENLTIAFPGMEQPAVSNLSLEVHRGETLAIVGESGSGKTVTCMALTGLLAGPYTWESGAAHLHLPAGNHALNNPAYNRKHLLGKHIGFLFQDPMSSLNPSMRVGQQVAEGLRHHLKQSAAQAHQEVLTLFDAVGLPNPVSLVRKYPHQLSGGQKQRVMMAMALACKPDLLLADEPTTALDATVQRQVLLVLKNRQRELGMGMVFITHDLAVAAAVADRVVVMRQGRAVETGNAATLFEHPAEPYTQALIHCRPRHGAKPHRLPTVDQYLNPEKPQPAARPDPPLGEVILEINQLKVAYSQPGRWWKRSTPQAVLHEFSAVLREGETLGLVGESGSGKSTVAKALLGLVPAAAGSILYRGTDLTQLTAHQWQQFRREIQMVFQDPYSSLNPAMTVKNMLLEVLTTHKRGGNSAERHQIMVDTLQKVGLGTEALEKYPHQFSGGQRQRIGIARALMLQPKILVLDESVAALDVSIQAQVLNLLNDLKSEFGFSYLFISHDLAVVEYMSNQLLVLHQGVVVERGAAQKVLSKPENAYTQQLVRAAPQPGERF